MVASNLSNIWLSHSRQVNVSEIISSHKLQFLTAKFSGQGTFEGLGFGVSTPQNPEKSLTILGSLTTGAASIMVLLAAVSSSLIASIDLSCSFNSYQVIHLVSDVQ